MARVMRITTGLLIAAAAVALGIALLPEVLAADPDRSVFLTRRMPYDAFDQLPQTRVRSGGADLAVAFAPGRLELAPERFIAWVQQRADIVAAYYGRFPVSSARILIIPVGGSGVRTGTSYGWRGAATKIHVGERTSPAELAEDWILVHEMVHFAHPSLADIHNWMGEGQATYIETIARVQAGDMDEAAAWSQFVQYMPQGLPQQGDRGLDFTPTWGRTYWGGALFCLYADVEIRKRTNNRYGLQDAMRAVVAGGGVTTQSWPIRQLLRTGDEATGAHVLEELYDELRAEPGKLELEQLWRELGLNIGSSSLSFDERAPLAATRRAIMSPPRALQ